MTMKHNIRPDLLTTIRKRMAEDASVVPRAGSIRRQPSTDRCEMCILGYIADQYAREVGDLTFSDDSQPFMSEANGSCAPTSRTYGFLPDRVIDWARQEQSQSLNGEGHPVWSAFDGAVRTFNLTKLAEKNGTELDDERRKAALAFVDELIGAAQ